ncbi:hypothetical protein BO71DRAFT_487340 [Aspergillus ellipticus CBS 707.79]|uniref:Uncharacterized protein n=1 Tax=Aspergillus ellipticus CBS 707.79 TaxID=1448320 RepID=A0A319DGJ4_9EURO|nr:hypothetical protein BO71DRAFT_487340 [Aspergillus ellipticus CBS 707.79]
MLLIQRNISNPDNEDIIRVDTCPIVAPVNAFADTLRFLIKLALLTWHFDATSELPSKELLNFFAHPDDKFKGVCQAICERYTTLFGASMSCCEFGEKFANHLGYLESGIAKGWYLVLTSRGQECTE